MLWKIARIYYQRPTIRDLIQLYAMWRDVFLASELEDLDVSEQVEPFSPPPSEPSRSLSRGSSWLRPSWSIPFLQERRMPSSPFESGSSQSVTVARWSSRKDVPYAEQPGESGKAARLHRQAGDRPAVEGASHSLQGEAQQLLLGAKDYAKEAGSSVLSKLGLARSRDNLYAELVQSISASGQASEDGTVDLDHNPPKP